MKRSMVFEGVAVTLLILLAFLTLAMVIGGGQENNVPMDENVLYTYVGPDDMLYVFSQGNIQAIDAGGNLAWKFPIPQGWEISTNCMPIRFASDGSFSFSRVTPSVGSGKGVLYVCLKPAHAKVSSCVMNVTLMAISRGEGRTLWELPMDSYALPNPYSGPDNSSDRIYGDVTIKTSSGIVYVFHNFNETVIDSNGTIIWSVANVSDPAAVDDNGYVYCVKSRVFASDDLKVFYTPLQGFPGPSSSIDAYYPNGTLYWENYTGNWIKRQYIFGSYDGRDEKIYSLPVYNGGLLYAPTENGINVFYPNGTEKWSKTFTADELMLDYPDELYQKQDWFVDQEMAAELSLYEPMPFDAQGNVYLLYQNYPITPVYRETLLISLDPDGNIIRQQNSSESPLPYYLYSKDGVGYNYNLDSPYFWSWNLTDFPDRTLRTYDIRSGDEIWSYRFEVKDPTIAIVDRSNVYAVLGGYVANEAIEHANDPYEGVQHGIYSGNTLDIQIGNSTVYANFQSYNYEYPVRLGRSKVAYAGGIYAIADNGSLLWYKPVRAQDYFMQVTQNGTVFYQTPDGKIGVTNAGIAAGFTLTALLYLFLRFTCVGAVARAKARLNKNDNRNRVLDFIIKNPGSTLYDVSRGTGVNLGTVRYHLFILNLNHKVVASGIDGKYIRYFTNSGAYSREQQLVLSLLRRDSMGKILGLLAKKPGISNVEIAGEVGIPESITSRYLKELSEKGVVKNLSSGRERAYSIDDAYRGPVADAVRRLQGQ